jgi:predicted transcriptional regulator
MDDICRNYHKGNQFSQQANRSLDKKAMVGLILDLIRNSAGLICEEIEDALGLKHQTVSARISELKRDGQVIVVGKRKTRSGCQAGIYRCRNEKPAQATLF